MEIVLEKFIKRQPISATQLLDAYRDAVSGIESNRYNGPYVAHRLPSLNAVNMTGIVWDTPSRNSAAAVIAEYRHASIDVIKTGGFNKQAVRFMVDAPSRCVVGPTHEYDSDSYDEMTGI